MTKVDLSLNEDREILRYILDLNISFKIDQMSENIIKYSFDRVVNKKIETFSFSTVSNNGISNTDFDLDLLDEIISWKNNDKISENFKLFL